MIDSQDSPELSGHGIISVKSITAMGIVSGTSGVAEAGRRASQVLAACGFNLEPGTLRHKQNGTDLFISLANADLTAKVFLECRPDLYAKSHVGFWAWELENFPWYLAVSAGLLDEIWANSGFAAQSIREATDTPVRVFPIPACNEGHSPSSNPSRYKKFIVAFDYRSDFERKNPLAAIQAFKLAFGESANVLLQIKVSNSKEYPEQHRKLLAAVGPSKNINIFERRLTRFEMSRWIAESHAFVSLHRSEGLGLNIMDAMSMGVPNVSTAYSANMEYQSDEDSLLIPFSLIPLKRYGPWKVNSRWADPEIEAAATALQSLAGSDSQWRSLSEASYTRAGREFSLSASVDKLMHGWDKR